MAADPRNGAPKPPAPGVEARPGPVPGVLQRDLGTEYVFYDEDGERFHVLNETARDIYLLCDGSRSIRDIARTLAETRAVDQDTASRDTQDAVGRMVQLGLLVLS
jgi:pyrroloquinoline quinone biosynthesis protein D